MIQRGETSEGKALLFSMGEQYFALAVEEVDRVLRAVQITTLPDAPPHLLGLMDMGGRQVPIVDLDRRLGLAPRSIGIDDRIILTNRPKQMGFFVDGVHGVCHFEADHFTSAEGLFPQLEHCLTGVGTWQGKTVLIFDCQRLVGDFMDLSMTAPEDNKESVVGASA
ncbi:MAG: purine-binding chemotaxis protein CheW [Magnetococcales bacterium]|nr:purine-binding chemotaxis protein CheW [Magnetococcales bacterium]